jgi:Domain of unknown function (DUF6134)
MWEVSMTDACSSSTRRQVLCGFAGSIALGLMPAALVARSAPADLHFVARRDGSRIGHHQVRFIRRDDRLEVDVDIQLDVTFAFIPLYRYRHRNHELWQGDRLIELESQTDDDGTTHWVRAIARDDRLVVESTAGALDLAADTATTSYWNETQIRAGRWLDTQSGRLVRSRVETHPPEMVTTDGQSVMAERYELAGDIDCDLWYHGGRWVKLRFRAPDGSTIDYVR